MGLIVSCWPCAQAPRINLSGRGCKLGTGLPRAMLLRLLQNSCRDFVSVVRYRSENRWRGRGPRLAKGSFVEFFFVVVGLKLELPAYFNGRYRARTCDPQRVMLVR